MRTKSVMKMGDWVLRSQPMVSLACGLAGMLFSGDYRLYGFYLAGYVAFNEVLTAITKAITKPYLERYLWLQRPNFGCTPLGTNCSVWSSECQRKNTPLPGFYSGHSSGGFYDAAFWSLVYSQANFYKGSHTLVVLIMFMRATLIASHRIYTGCHSVLQVIVGMIMGLFGGWVTYMSLNKKYPKRYPLRDQWLIDMSFR